MWNPYAGKQGTDGRYSGDWVRNTQSIRELITKKGYDLEFNDDELTQGDVPQDSYLSQGQLIDLFRDDFNKKWWDPLEAKISGGSFTRADIIEYVQSFDYSYIFPNKNVPWSLHAVEGGMFQVIDPSGATVFREDLFKGETGIFPGYLGKIWSGDLSGRGVFMVTTQSGYDVRFSIALEGRIIN
ncbi:MAG: hypothetical protein JST46_04330 [Bacteroidetes bacterium]|nr:hypothetical protein [Bacteroidota bacterium]